jgi:hypothetical protein
MQDICKLKTRCSITGRALNEDEENKIKDVKKKLYEKAIQMHKDISLCANKGCFQLHQDSVLFWFNVDDNTTKVLQERINN